MNSKSNITLIGMPGAGKSSIGVVLAKILNYNFVDVDIVIQQRHGQTLQQLIDTLGTEKFINLEGEALKSLDYQHTIISTGGSAVYSPEGMAHLAQNSRIVYLQVALPELQERLQDFSNRGVVMRGATCEGLKDLYNERTPLYEKYAQLTVNINGLSITDSARKVIQALGGTSDYLLSR